MRILVTGSRDWPKPQVIAEVLRGLIVPDGDITLVSGGARGVDRTAEKIAEELRWIIERHDAEWEKYPRAAGIIRNKKMVDLGADVCVAFIYNNSRGATHCANLAEKAGIKTLIWRVDD